MLRTALIPVIPAAVLSLIAGCTSNNSKSAPRAAEPRTSIQAYNVTHVPEEPSRHVMAYPTGDRRTSCLLIEQLAPGEVRLNRELTYQIKITNLTSEPVRGIVLRSRPLDGLAVLASSATTRPIGDGQLVYEIGDLGPRESTTIDVRALPGRLGKVEAAYVVSTRPPVLYTALNVVQPILKVASSAPADVDICQDIVHRYTVTNAGTGVAREVTLQAALPDGMTTTDEKNVLSAALGDIPEGASRDVTARLRVARPGRYTSTAIARSRDDGSTRSEPVVTAAHAPNLTIAARGPESEQAGKPVTYILTVTNTGDAPARAAELKLSTSDIAQITAIRTDTDAGAPGEPQLASAGVVDVTSPSLGTLAPGQSRRIEVTATPIDGGTLTLDAVATATCSPEARTTARTRVLTQPALSLTATEDVDPAPVGQLVTYTVTVTNTGTGSDTNVRLTANLPADHLAYVQSTGPTDPRLSTTTSTDTAATRFNTLTFPPIPRLAAGESATWQVTVRPLRAADTQLHLSATSDSLKTPAQRSEPTRLY